MSIIEEALRRVKDPVSSKVATLQAPSQPSAAQSPPPQTLEAPQPHSWSSRSASTPARRIPLSAIHPSLFVVAVVVFGLLVAAFLIGGALWLGTAMKRGGTSPLLTERGTSPIAVNSRASSEAPGTDLILTGVVEGLGEPYAVINGMIVGIGEQLHGTTVEAIANGTVKLRFPDGREGQLRVQH